MAFNTLNTLGINYSDVFVPATSGYTYGQQPPFAVGTESIGTDGSTWVYVVYSTGGATGPGYVLTLAPATWTAVMLSTSNDVYGNQVAVAPAVAASGSYGWVQRAGVAQVRCEQDALANNRLGPTADAGQVDDASATIGDLYISGMTLTTARGGTDGLAPAILNHPWIDTVADITP